MDCENPTFVAGTSKAKWGLDILFKEEHNSFTTSLDEFSNQRIQIIKINLGIPLIIINVYLPSSSIPETDYESCLTLLSVALERYSSEAACVLSGDFNRSLFRNTASDKKFQLLCTKMGLVPAEGTTDRPTYHGYNGSSSRIHYVLLHKDSCIYFGLQITDVQIVDHICKNENIDIISTHDLLSFEINIPCRMENESEATELPKVSTLEIKKLMWKD